MFQCAANGLHAAAISINKNLGAHQIKHTLSVAMTHFIRASRLSAVAVQRQKLVLPETFVKQFVSLPEFQYRLALWTVRTPRICWTAVNGTLHTAATDRSEKSRKTFPITSMLIRFRSSCFLGVCKGHEIVGYRHIGTISISRLSLFVISHVPVWQSAVINEWQLSWLIWI